MDPAPLRPAARRATLDYEVSGDLVTYTVATWDASLPYVPTKTYRVPSAELAREIAHAYLEGGRSAADSLYAINLQP